MKNIKKTIIALPALLFPAGVALAAAFENPLGDNVTVSDLIQKIINWLLGIVGLLALLAVIFGGVRIILAFGDEGQVKQGKLIITWAVGGVAIVALAWVAISAVKAALGVQ